MTRLTCTVLWLLAASHAKALIPEEPAQIPAPETLPLLLVGGAVGLALYLKRRK